MPISKVIIRKKRSKTGRAYYYVIYSATLAEKRYRIHWIIGYNPKQKDESPMTLDRLAKIASSLSPDQYIHFAYITSSNRDKGLVFTATTKFPAAFAVAMIRIAQEAAVRCEQAATVTDAHDLASRFFHAFWQMLKKDSREMTELAKSLGFTDESLFGGRKRGE